MEANSWRTLHDKRGKKTEEASKDIQKRKVKRSGKVLLNGISSKNKRLSAERRIQSCKEERILKKEKENLHLKGTYTSEVLKYGSLVHCRILEDLNKS